MAFEGADIAARVEELRSRLEGTGADSWADALGDAIGGGATGTEILDRLAVTLDGVRRDRAVGRDDRRRATRIRRAVVRRLRRP